MSMFSRTATIVRRNRRKSGGKLRRGSAPVVLQPSSPSTQLVSRPYLTPQPSPAKSVSFTFEERNGRLSVQGDIISYRAQSLSPADKCYDTIVTWQDSYDRDPSFTFLSGLMEASSESISACEFLYRAFHLLSGTWPMMLVVTLLLPMPLSMLILGVKYLDECPREPKLPIYLLVGGIFGTIKVTLLLCTQLQRIRGDEGDEIRDDGDPFTMGKVVNIGLSLFLSVWFALGNYWFFKTGKPNYLPPLHEPRNWCDRTVHVFTFWHVIVCYILIGAIFLLGFVFVCCFACLKLVGENEKG